MFLACGSEDFVYECNLEFHTFLEGIGYPHTWWVKPGIHNFDFWNRSMPAGMDWLKQE